MNFRLASSAIIIAICSVVALSASAHDPEQFDRLMTKNYPLKVPTTCEQLADTSRYSTDVSNPEIKTLTARCDNAAKAAEKAETTATTPDKK